MSPIRVARGVVSRTTWDRVVMCVAIGLALWGVMRSNTAATNAKSAVADIQVQRVDNARIACADANEANARLRVALLKFIPHPTGEQKQAIGMFADAIAVPRSKRECDAFVLARVGHK